LFNDLLESGLCDSPDDCTFTTLLERLLLMRHRYKHVDGYTSVILAFTVQLLHCRLDALKKLQVRDSGSVL
jgi:hypothetical protein